MRKNFDIHINAEVIISKSFTFNIKAFEGHKNLNECGVCFNAYKIGVYFNTKTHLSIFYIKLIAIKRCF